VEEASGLSPLQAQFESEVEYQNGSSHWRAYRF
jgi:hypothetical protein